MADKSQLNTEVIEALREAMSRIGMAAKGGDNQFHGYKYATLEDYLDAVRQHCLDCGLVLTSSLVERPEFIDDRKSDKGKALTICRLAVETKVVHAATGGAISTMSYGEAFDAEDKAVYKAFTGARKYGIAMLFGIYTTDDPEKYSQEPASKLEEAAAALVAKAELAINEADSTDALDKFSARLGDLKQSGQIGAEDFSRLMQLCITRAGELSPAPEAEQPVQGALLETDAVPEGVGV